MDTLRCVGIFKDREDAGFSRPKNTNSQILRKYAFLIGMSTFSANYCDAFLSLA